MSRALVAHSAGGLARSSRGLPTLVYGRLHTADLKDARALLDELR